jgi:hypothetical protein
MSLNISVPEELIQDVSDQNVIVSGHSQLVDVSCQHLDVSGNTTLDGTLNVIGTLDVGGHTQLVDVSCTTLEVVTINNKNNGIYFDTIRFRDANFSGENKVQLWINNQNVLPNIGSKVQNDSDNISFIEISESPHNLFWNTFKSNK